MGLMEGEEGQLDYSWWCCGHYRVSFKKVDKTRSRDGSRATCSQNYGQRHCSKLLGQIMVRWGGTIKRQGMLVNLKKASHQPTNLWFCNPNWIAKRLIKNIWPQHLYPHQKKNAELIQNLHIKKHPKIIHTSSTY